MKIPLVLNEKQVVIEAEPSEKLLFVLRREKLNSCKHGCHTASCGACHVLVDDKAAASCRLPVGILRGSHIVTLEHFSKTEVYQDIMKGFEKAGISLCGYCNAGKIFSAYEIIKNLSHPNRAQISQIVSQLNDCCVEREILINGILYAFAIHFDKEKMRKNGK